MTVLPSLPNALNLTRLDRPEGTLLLLWPTLSALWLSANGFPGWHLLVVFVLGTYLMRSAGCAINDVFDRDIDKHVKRTAQRPVTTGTVSVGQALRLAALLAGCAFALVLTTNGLTVGMAILGMVITIAYPLCKRVMSIPQAFLGVAFSFGVPMAFAATTNSVPLLAWLMWLANLFWVIAYDTVYAMVDRDDDLKLNIKTSAITFGRHDVGIVMLCYAVFLLGTAGVGVAMSRGWWFITGCVVAAGLVVYFFLQFRGRERMACFRAFRQNHWIALVIFLGLLLDDAMVA